MATLFSIHATPHPKGMGKPSVHARAGQMAGVYDEELGIIVPDADAIRAALPHYWRKAWDRGGGSFWFDTHGRLTAEGYKGTTPHLNLRDSRGRPLATVYAIPYRFEPKGPQKETKTMDATHIDTCLSCYLQDHHNRPGELLLGAIVDGATTYEELLEELLTELNARVIDDESFDYDAARTALYQEFSTVSDMSKPFDPSLEIAPGDDQEHDPGELVQAWFVLSWETADA